MLVSAGTHTGLLRPLNEDSYFFCTAPDQKDCYLIIVADGMGGHKAGEVASKMAITSLKQHFLSLSQNFNKLDSSEMEKLLTAMVVEVNDEIYKASLANESFAGMGTTLTMGIVVGYNLWIAHIGDSRAYLIREGVIYKLTEDHSLVGELITKGKLTESEASSHPHRNILTRALGSEVEVLVDVHNFSIQENDVLIFATDGLTNLLTAEEINQMVEKAANFTEIAQDLIALANRRGGPDNITVVLVRC